MIGTLLAILAVSKAPATRLGPIYSGEPVADVRHVLGTGTPVTTCAPDPKLKSSDCPLALAYRDGKNTLTIGFDGSDAVVTMRVDLADRKRHAVAARVASGAFERWRWAGHPIDRLPTAPVAGWKGASSAPHADCYVTYEGPARPTGPKLIATFACAEGSDRIATFMTGFVDP